MAAPALSLSHVSLYYDHDIQALHDVTLDVAEGERVCVLGPNGSGKSTLASVLCGLLAPDEGSVTLAGEHVLVDGKVDFEAYRRARRQLGLVFQNPDDQIVTTVVEEDVAFGPENLGVPPQEIGERVHRELHRVALEPYAKADPTRLSGGQKQRVAIAGALAMEPRAIVFDEPGALLDVRGRRSIMHVMDRLKESGITQVHITHFMEEAFAADRVIVMDAGSVVLEGTPEEVFSHVRQIRGLGLTEPFAADLATRLRDRGVNVPWTCDEDRLERAIVDVCQGKSPEEGSARGADDGEKGGRSAPRTTGEAALRVEDVTFSYAEGDPGAQGGRERALDGVSFSVRPGETCAIIGQTGSGKSTLLRLLCALEVPDSGRVLVGGIDTSRKRDRRLVHGRIGYVMQYPERQLFAETVADDVAFGPRNLGLSQEEVERRTERALQIVGLGGKDAASPFELSGGQQRLCALAGVLAMHPQTLVLDEPTAGLDPHGRGELHRILDELSSQGVTIIQVTHSMEDAARCQRVVVLDESHLLARGSARQVFRPQSLKRLRDCGLGLPRPLELAIELARDGVALDLSPEGEPLTTEELVDQLTALARPADPRPAGPTIPSEGAR